MSIHTAWVRWMFLALVRGQERARQLELRLHHCQTCHSSAVCFTLRINRISLLSSWKCRKSPWTLSPDVTPEYYGILFFRLPLSFSFSLLPSPSSGRVLTMSYFFLHSCYYFPTDTQSPCPISLHPSQLHFSSWPGSSCSMSDMASTALFSQIPCHTKSYWCDQIPTAINTWERGDLTVDHKNKCQHVQALC